MTTEQYQYERFNDEQAGRPQVGNQYIMSNNQQQYSPQVLVQQPSIQQPPIYPYPTEQEAKWSWARLVLSVVSFFCCVGFGFVATIMAVLAYTDHKAQDYEGSRRKHQVALGLAITGIVLGTISTVIFIIVIAQ